MFGQHSEARIRRVCGPSVDQDRPQATGVLSAACCAGRWGVPVRGSPPKADFGKLEYPGRPMFRLALIIFAATAIAVSSAAAHGVALTKPTARDFDRVQLAGQAAFAKSGSSTIAGARTRTSVASTPPRAQRLPRSAVRSPWNRRSLGRSRRGDAKRRC